MNEELLNTLIAALQVSPENALLRQQVLQGLVEAQRWEEAQTIAPPLLKTEHRASALIALARAAFADGDTARAAELYNEAVEIDEDLIDEQFEAAFEPEERLRLPVQGEPASSYSFQPYNGPRITFEDVGGMNALKEQIRLNIIYPFQHPEIYEAYGRKSGGGILMYGPPGCGKTYIARASAGELGANFYFLELSEILDMWFGETEKRLGELFDTARANSPSVIFIDEIDAIGGKRSHMNSSGGRMSVTQLLTEMDGLASRNESLLVMGATNAPWDIDVAFRRPGRFDRVLFVPPPDSSARAEVLRLHARGRKIDPNLPWQQIADKAEHFSGADLAGLLDRACESALSDAIKYGRQREVNLQDFQQALRNTRASTIEWLSRAKNYVTYANQDGLYDDLAAYITQAKIK